jgi:hypothetical protein
MERSGLISLANSDSLNLLMVAMGLSVVPILLDAMRSAVRGNEYPIGHWFLVVRDICPDHPEIPEAIRGKIRDIEALYVKWGEEKGFLA